MKVGVPRETTAGERRVALVPDAAGRLVKAGLEVVVEAGAGDAATFTDDLYTAAGATIGTTADALRADIVVKVLRPSDSELAQMREGATLIAFLQPLADPVGVERIAARGVTAFAMESIPRTTRAQSMDALSSQATVVGYKAVLLAADRLPKLFPMLTTAAGTIAPARVLVLGAGVAGLQAIATARRLGAVVLAFDVRDAVKEQVESLGAKFLDLGVRAEETAGGYASELTEEQRAEQQRRLTEQIVEMDAVVTTAAVPGRPAPKLITSDAVARMRFGSVIVDVAAESGGNCEVTQPGEEIVRDGVTVIGVTNLASTMPVHASQLYARNVTALLEHLVKDGQLALDFEDEITAGACVARPKVVA